MNRKIGLPVLGSALAFLLGTSCCWLPFLAAAVFGSTVGAAAFSSKVEPFGVVFMAVGAGLAAFAAWRFFRKSRASAMPNLVLQSRITCPKCGFQKTETMPTDACQYFYECENCRTVLKPNPGDCCVFCSFGTVKCPPIQTGGHCC
jgi:hypothetical protein